MEKILDQLGFSKYKKQAYISLIKLEKAPPLKIAKNANIPSSKIYEILNSLHKDGYISLTCQKPLEYRANNPKSILKSDVNSKINKLKEIEEEINHITTILPITETANIQIISSRNAFFKKVKETITKSNNSIIAIVKNWKIDYELNKLTREFTKRGGEIRFLGPINKENRTKIKEWEKTGIKIKNLNPNTTRFTVWDQKTIAIGFKDEDKKDYTSLWIEDPYLGKILTEYFNTLWDQN